MWIWKETRRNLKKILDENGVPIEKLKGTPYYFTAKGFGTVNNDKVVLLLNAFIYPTNLKVYKKQNEKQIIIVLKAVIAPTGQELPPLTVALDKEQIKIVFDQAQKELEDLKLQKLQVSKSEGL